MAYDLLFRRQIRRNWARSSSLPAGFMGADSVVVPSGDGGPSHPSPTHARKARTFVPTEAEKQLLAKVAVLKMAATSGHKGARKELQNVAVKVLQVKSKAALGDPKAAHLVEVLRDSKIFAASTSPKLLAKG